MVEIDRKNEAFLEVGNDLRNDVNYVGQVRIGALKVMRLSFLMRKRRLSSR